MRIKPKKVRQKPVRLPSLRDINKKRWPRYYFMGSGMWLELMLGGRYRVVDSAGRPIQTDIPDMTPHLIKRVYNEVVGPGSAKIIGSFHIGAGF